MAVTIEKKFYTTHDSYIKVATGSVLPSTDLQKIVFTSTNMSDNITAGTRSHTQPGGQYLGTWYESYDILHKASQSQDYLEYPLPRKECLYRTLTLLDDVCTIQTGASGTFWHNYTNEGPVAVTDDSTWQYKIGFLGDTTKFESSQLTAYGSEMALFKTIIIDITSNQGGTGTGIRSIEFYDHAGNLIELPNTSYYTAYGSSYAVSNPPAYAFNTSLSETGPSADNEWYSTSTTNIRLICVFTTSRYISKIVINNSHDSGASTTKGVNAYIIYASTTSYTTLTYGTITGLTRLCGGNLRQHVATDTRDDQIVYERDATLGWASHGNAFFHYDKDTYGYISDYSFGTTSLFGVDVDTVTITFGEVTGGAVLSGTLSQLYATYSGTAPTYSGVLNVAHEALIASYSGTGIDVDAERRWGGDNIFCKTDAFGHRHIDSENWYLAPTNSVVFELTFGEAYDCKLTAWDDDTHSTTNNKILEEGHYRVDAATYKYAMTSVTWTSDSTAYYHYNMTSPGCFVCPPVRDHILKGDESYYGTFDLVYAVSLRGDCLIFKPRLYNMDDSFTAGNYDFVTTLHYQYT